jgi:hypothetical protein
MADMVLLILMLGFLMNDLPDRLMDRRVRAREAQTGVN